MGERSRDPHQYQPKIEPAHWEAIRDFVREVATQTEGHIPYSVGTVYNTMTEFALWGWQVAALPLETRAMLDRSVIAYYIQVGCGQLTAAARGNRRSILLRIAKFFATIPAKRLPPLPASNPSAPYTAREQVSILSWARAQSTADYKVDQLGEKGGYMGAIQVEGAWYCPAMPADLINATKDVRAHRIDFETWRTRIDSREKYLLRRKQKPDARGDVPMMCPAIGPNATLDCPWRQGQRKAEWDLIKDKRRRTKTPFPVLESQLPDRRLPICTNKASVTFPLATDAKYIQAVRFGTKTWKKLYSHARNMIESANRYVKDDAKEALSSEGRRRARGSSQQYVMVSMLIFAANLRRINTHKFGQPYAPRTIPDIRRRDITNGYLYDPETNTGIAPNAGIPGGFIADDVFSGDI
ncbi:hypothetical protein DEI81_11235 [Curtobacterium sp. MCBD17_013]|uniref:hypothetical protein n=1 Tax=Curtobacterium sp. MCBD17_013 TaxID=2175668 RepID=UPI000DA872B7|nr:hypothetical protein [Curtobacterium sp. MCBD17_013]PZF61594.1 hypothetical protein DEI81_11235 [Curtobacterium sp. MCBD17_013]